jgi:hypothetical protein
MNRANQLQVVHETNMNLVNIRSKELEFFSYFFAPFGTNAVLMAGFMASSLSQQNPGYDSEPGAPYGSVVFYWISCALCAITGIYALCGSEMVLVFGQNLAINGPTGSMVRALEGMVQEQRTVLMYAMITAFFFICQAVGMFWFRMDQISAITTSCICGFAIVVSYYWLLRIYNRFKFKKTVDMEWDSEKTAELRDLDPSAVEDISTWVLGSGKSYYDSEMQRRSSMNMNPLHGEPMGGGGPPGMAVTGTRTGTGTRTQSMGGSDVGSGISMKTLLKVTNPMSSTSKGGESSDLFIGGLLTMRSRNGMGMSVWKRRYIVLKNNLIYLYRSKRDFMMNPIKSLNSRPINLEGYTLLGGALEPPYPISLTPMDAEDPRKVWKFRCDTLTEFQRWMEVLMTAIALSNEGQEMPEFTQITVAGNGNDNNGSAYDDGEEDDD